MVMSNVEGDVLDELGSGLNFLIGAPQLVPEVKAKDITHIDRLEES